MHHRTPDEEHARTCGLRMLEISHVYEDAIVPSEADLGNLSIVGLVARQRRLLKAAYLLADAGMRLEAGMLIRVSLEYLIVQKWLIIEPRLHHLLWVKNDLESRLRIDCEVREGAPDEHGKAIELMEPEVRERYERSLEGTRADLERAQAELGLERPPSYPKLIKQAAATGLSFAYTIAYRYESQIGVHPTPMGIEVLMEEHELGIQMKPGPPPEQGYADPYAVGAFLLRDALLAAAEVVPELRLDGLDETVAELEKVAKPE